MLTKSKFIERCKENHNDSIDYTKTIYKGLSKDIVYDCEKHGEIKQLALDHKMYGCRKCRAETIPIRKSEAWATMGGRSKNFDGFKFYILECRNENEFFYKYGITFLSIENRCKNLTNKYSYKLIFCFKSNSAHEIMQKELNFKHKIIKNKYSPVFNFNGHGECFKF